MPPQATTTKTMTFSVEVFRRDKLAERFGSSLDTHVDDVAEGYRVNLGGIFGPGLPITDIRPVLENARQMVGQLRTDLGEANMAHLEELADDHHLLVERDELTRALADKFRSLRSVCQGAFGQENLHQLALGSPPPRNAATLHDVCELVTRRIQADDLELPESVVRGIEPNPELAETLQPEYGLLGKKLSKLESEDRESDKTLIRKHKAIDTFDKYFIPITRLVVTVYRLAGMEEEAKRVKPKVRQVKGVEQIDTDDEPGSEIPAAEPPAGPTPKPATL